MKYIQSRPMTKGFSEDMTSELRPERQAKGRARRRLPFQAEGLPCSKGECKWMVST